MKFKKLLLLLIVLSACSRNPVTGKKEVHFVSEAQEIVMGSEQYLLMQQAEGGTYTADTAVMQYVQKVGQKLASVSDRNKLPYEFVVLDNPIPNAWALPGGKIAINRGLLLELKSEAELAAVLSHEIVHSAARHGAKAMERSLLMQIGLVGMQGILEGSRYKDLILGSGMLGSALVHLKYSREAELEADAYGIKYMAHAGYDPRAAIELQRTFLRLADNKAPNFLSGLFATHPPSKERIEENEKTAAIYLQDTPLIDGKEEYAQAIASLQKAKPAQECLQKGYEALSDHPKEALASAEQGLRIAPREAHLYNLAGKAKLALKDFKGAFSCFQKACDLNPSYFDFYLGIGLAEHGLKLERAAQSHLEKSLSLFPTVEAHATLGNIHLQNNDTLEALAHFEIASQSNSPLGKQALASFQKLDLKEHPERYTTLSTFWNEQGNLSLILKNDSTLPIHDILVEIAFQDAKGPVVIKSIRIPAALLPSQEKTLTTSFSQHTALSVLTTKIIKLEIYHYEH